MIPPTDERYQRTARGRAEMRVRRHELTRDARNLLRIISATSPGAHWMAMVGCGRADLQQLLAAGLVAPAIVSVPEKASRRSPPAPTPSTFGAWIGRLWTAEPDGPGSS